MASVLSMLPVYCNPMLTGWDSAGNYDEPSPISDCYRTMDEDRHYCKGESIVPSLDNFIPECRGIAEGNVHFAVKENPEIDPEIVMCEIKDNVTRNQDVIRLDDDNADDDDVIILDEEENISSVHDVIKLVEEENYDHAVVRLDEIIGFDDCGILQPPGIDNTPMEEKPSLDYAELTKASQIPFAQLPRMYHQRPNTKIEPNAVSHESYRDRNFPLIINKYVTVPSRFKGRKSVHIRQFYIRNGHRTEKSIALTPSEWRELIRG